jgi:membrane protein YdbS with pleckstrin-like domain
MRAPGLDDRDRTLDPRVVQVWRVMTTLGLLIPLSALSLLGVLALGRPGIAAPVLAVVVLAVMAGWYPRARWQRWRWRLTPLALELRFGVVVHTQESVPYFRIQQIDIAQGPLDRLLELATLQVTTASASGSVSLPGIPAEQAPAVRAELLARAAEAVAEHPGEVRDAV